MSQGVAVVGKHEYLLELITGADGQLEDILLGLGGDAREVPDGVSDCGCRGILVDSTYSMSLLEDVFGDVGHGLDQLVLADALAMD